MRAAIRNGLIFLVLAAFPCASFAETLPSEQPLVQESDLTYQGAFRLPSLPSGGRGAQYGFDYAVSGIAYHPANDSLFINNHVYEQKTAELSIPAPSMDIGSLPIAAFRQDFADITEGRLRNILSGGATYTNSTNMGGLLVQGDKLIGTSYAYYDGAMQARLSHFISSTILSEIGDFKGMVAVGVLNPGFVAGYMAEIPAEWRAAFGGPALTGQCCLSIIGRTSQGPSAFVFDPADIGVKNPVPATPLVYYDSSNPTLGTWGNTSAINLQFNMSTAINGASFPSGTRSVLFFGRQGIGVPCYGAGTADQSLDRQPVPDTGGQVMYCFDPADSSKGNHAYPYKYWVWAYDANELLAVKKGEKNPWEVKPYAVWPLNIPWPASNTQIQGVGYDPATRRLFISQAFGDALVPGSSPYNAAPLIHVFQVTVGAAAPVDTTAPTVPAQLTANAVSSDRIDISWAASLDDRGVTGYQVSRNGAPVGTSTTTSFGDTGLSAGTSYSYTVSAMDAAGNVSAPSSAVTMTTKPTLDTTAPVITGISTSGLTASTANISWATNEASDSRINYGTSLPYARTAFDGSFVTSHYISLIGLTPGVPYYYEVISQDAAGNRSTSARMDFRTQDVVIPKDTHAPTTPTNLKTSSKNRYSIDLTWTASTDNIGVKGYKVFRNNVHVATTTTTNYTNQALAAGRTYTFRVSAFDAAGNNSGLSNPSTSTTHR